MTTEAVSRNVGKTEGLFLGTILLVMNIQEMARIAIKGLVVPFDLPNPDPNPTP